MLTKNAKSYIEKAGLPCGLAATDPELYDIICNFACDEAVNEHALPHRTRHLAILAALIGCGGREVFGCEVSAALAFGVTPVEIREAVYQSVAYLGVGRALPFINIANDEFKKAGVSLPLAAQGTVEYADRVQSGEDVQVRIFGEGMRGFSRRGGDTEHINRWLSGNCFGDYYTRSGLSDNDREMITFCYLAAQGGCEPQLISHAAANMRIGNDKNFLISVVSQCLPYIGYPRSLNALNCIEQAASKS